MNRNVKIATIAMVAAMLVVPTLFQAHATAPFLYDLTGTWIWRYTYLQNNISVTENHTMVINFFNFSTGDFWGCGFNSDNSTYNWTVAGSALPGGTVQFRITYDPNSPIPQYYIDATGTLISPTDMIGNATLLSGGEMASISEQGAWASWEATKMSSNPNVILNFRLGSNITSVNVTEYTSTPSPYPPLLNETGPIYNITVVTGNSTTSLAGTRIGLHYDPSSVTNASRLVIAQFILLGDVNHDGEVNLLDLVILAKAYGSKPGDSNWNPNADIDGNGIVALADLVTLALNYGKTEAEWIDRRTTVDTANNFVYCTTNHFSGIGIHT